MKVGIRGKLISIFLLIKIIPLVLLSGVAWDAIEQFGDTAKNQSKVIIDQMRTTVLEAGEMSVSNSVKALDEKGRHSIERQSTELAKQIADFLYDRDSDILYVATLTPSIPAFKAFLDTQKRSVIEHAPWVINDAGDKWIPKETTQPSPANRKARVAENKEEFHYRRKMENGSRRQIPLYVEMTYLDTSGQEIIKVTDGSLTSSDLKNVSRQDNTFIKAETYFSALKDLKPGEIYVSSVIGAHVPSPIIGPYTKTRAQDQKIAFEPEKAAYAGKENPVGKRFKGLVRWATPVVTDGKITGYVTLALNHRHLMEFSDHHIPTDERYSPISDAASGNYAFMWDSKGRNISHPRDYFIAGYDPKTGQPSIPWLPREIYDNWKASAKPFAEFIKDAPWFHKPGGTSKPATEQIKAGQLGLDCRYLDFAPQCAGWWNLTEEGGSGSFKILWSGLWKLSTAATIPYYTGPYADSPRGFGFVTIGANVDEFHKAANETRNTIASMIALQDAKAAEQEEGLFDKLEKAITKIASDLSVYTGLMIIIVILIAVWMANSLSARITNLISSLHKIEQGDLKERADVESNDEMGELATSLNNMTESLQVLVERNKEAVSKAEASSQAKTDFLANMSHELRTPLNAILGFSDFIRTERKGKVDPPIYKRFAEDIYVAGDHLLALINDILDMSRIGAGEMDINEQDIDVANLIEHSMRMIEHQAEEKNISCSRDIKTDCLLRGDRRRIKQICLNLLSNAVKFTPKDGTILITAQRAEDGSMELIFKDSGIGMDQEDIRTALTPFGQVQSSLSREYDGTGLGLPLAKTLAKLHDGDLFITSEPGTGTEIIVTFPANRVISLQGDI